MLFQISMFIFLYICFFWKAIFNALQKGKLPEFIHLLRKIVIRVCQSGYYLQDMIILSDLTRVFDMLSNQISELKVLKKCSCPSKTFGYLTFMTITTGQVNLNRLVGVLTTRECNFYVTFPSSPLAGLITSIIGQWQAVIDQENCLRLRNVWWMMMKKTRRR